MKRSGKMKKMMHTTLKSAALFAVFSLIIAGCATGKQSAAARKHIPGAPEWVLNPPQDKDVIYAVGSAKMATVDMSMNIAEARARLAVARELSSVARQMIDDYAADASEMSGNKRDAEVFSQNVSRTLSEAKMAGAKVVKRDVTGDGTWWCLVSYNKSAAARDALAEINKEKINYAQFKNWNAQRDMDAAFAARENTDMEYVKD